MEVEASILKKNDMPHDAHAEANQSASKGFRRKTILVISDDIHVATLLQFLLDREGYGVTLMVDGHVAIQYVKQASEPPAMVLLDIMLPIVDGYEVMRTVAAHPGWGIVPIVILSGRNDESDVVRAFACGADDYITKPFQLGELLARIKRLIKENTQ